MSRPLQQSMIQQMKETQINSTEVKEMCRCEIRKSQKVLKYTYTMWTEWLKHT